MTPRRSKREIERALNAFDDSGTSDTPGLCMFPSPPPESDRLVALRTATKMDWEAQRERRNADPLLIATEAVQREFRGRLAAALADLRANTGIHIPLVSYLRYVHDLVEGDAAPTESGVEDALHSDVTPEQVDSVWEQSATAAPSDYPRLGSEFGGTPV